mgnify:CR=1 FL=1
MGDYAIWTETAEFARGNRPDFIAQSLNAGALVRLDVDTFLVLDRNLETRASLALDATAAQEYEIPPDPELLAVIKQARDLRTAERQSRQRARHRAARAGTGAVRRAPDLRQHGHRPAAGLDRIRARVHARRWWSAWAASRRGRSPAIPWPTSIAPACLPRCATGCAIRR